MFNGFGMRANKKRRASRRLEFYVGKRVFSGRMLLLFSL